VVRKLYRATVQVARPEPSGARLLGDGVPGVYREIFSREVPPYAEYTDAYDIEEVSALVRGEIVSRWREVTPEQFGDVILLRVRGQPCHVGVVVARGKFLHSLEGTQSCVERYENLKWHRRTLGFYRYAG
jgi:cell wall-associated NlpC family hydrolase